jgi:hypothetical protein
MGKLCDSVAQGTLIQLRERGSLTHETVNPHGVMSCRLRILSEPAASTPSKGSIFR